MVLETLPAMSTEQAILATRDQRIASVSQFIESKAKRFHRTLKPRERANFDAEDLAIELYIILAERDHKWAPTDGKYITFAGAVINRALSDIRDMARTVASPRNSACRMKEYMEEESGGNITMGRSKTANDIRRTKEGIGAISSGASDSDIPYQSEDKLEAQERAAVNRTAISEAIASALSPFEAQVIGQLYSLWDRSAPGDSGESLCSTAWALQREPSEVRQARDSALAKIRRFIEETGQTIPRPNWTYEGDLPDADDRNL